MRNVWLIMRRDVANLVRNVMSVIITVGLVLLPSLFAWYNILACWNVFDNTGYLSIAVASEDEGYTSELVPLDVNVGDRVVAALRANDQINWVITTGEDAVEGAKSGKYYAALVIPKDFSRQMLTFYEDESAGSAEIRYYVNKKVNAIAPNITGAGADTVSYEVNATFAQTMSQVAAALAQSLVQHADDEGLSGKIALVSDRMRTMAERVEQAGDVLGLYSGLAGDTQGLVANGAQIAESARAQAQDAAANVDADKEAVRTLADRLASSADALSDSLQNSEASLADLESRAGTLLDASSQDALDAAASLRSAASDVDSQVGDMNSRLVALQQLRDDLHSGVGPSYDTTLPDGTEASASVEISVESTVLLDKAIATLSRSIELAQQLSNNLVEAADSLEAGDADARQRVASLQGAAAQARADLDALKADFNNNVKPGIDKLEDDLAALAADLDSAGAKLDEADSGLPGAADEAQDALGDVASKVDAAHQKLGAVAGELSSLADAIDSALLAGDSQQLRSLLEGNVDDLAAALSAPVQVNRQALFPVENFGSAMAPLYSALALFIGSLLIMVAVKPEVSARGREELRNPKPRQLYVGRFGVVALLSLMQTTLLGLGAMLLLKVQVTEPLLFMLCFWVAGLVFAFMIYTLVVAFGNLGKALAVLLLIVQVTGCGGSYPLPIMPDFVQFVSPYLPATHVVDALRAAMFGVYQGDFWISMGKLVLFVAPFMLLGFVLRKPLDRFMHFYVRKVEESGVIE